jgi:uncharacterized protein HemY
MELARRNPDRSLKVAALVRSARILAGRGDAGAARQVLEGALTLASRDARLLLLVGDAYRDAVRDPSAARRAYERALAQPLDAVLRGQIRGRLEPPAVK